ncbi:MAG: hypothetical protein ACI92I_000706 [Acidimicrobiales bacterium]|jgi:hypothetical protein
MIRIIEYLKNNGTLCFAIGSTFVMFLYATLILGRVSSCFTLEVGTNSLGLSFSYTKDIVQTFFTTRTEEQLLCYSQFLQIWDVIFAFVYTCMYTSWIMYFFKNKRLFLIIPILVMIADWLENYVELLMLKTYLNSNTISESLVSLGSLINSFKFSLSSLTSLILLIGILITLKTSLIKRASRKNKPEKQV